MTLCEWLTVLLNVQAWQGSRREGVCTTGCTLFLIIVVAAGIIADAKLCP
jgi:hypothetical protein